MYESKTVQPYEISVYSVLKHTNTARMDTIQLDYCYWWPFIHPFSYFFKKTYHIY